MDADRNLLFGVLALHLELIDANQFADACAAWAARKEIPLAELLVERGWLTASDRADIDKLLERKLTRHSGDVKASLAEVTTLQVRQSLAGIDDPDVRHSLSPPVDGHVLVHTTDYAPEANDRYTLSRLHATGGIGRVWLARDASLGRDVALKELRPERADQPAMWGRFLREAQVTGQLEHPGIVPVYELGRRSDDDQPFYTMRFVRGRTLAEAAKSFHERRKREEAGPLEFRALLAAFVGVCNAVAYAHSRGVLHRDLKPQNVVLGDYGEVMVLDWGLAKVVGETDGDEAADRPPVALAEGSRDETVAGQVLGTPAYMAPEQAEGRLDLLDARTDVYGLGAVLYEVLTGQPPFSGPDTLAVLRKVVHEPPPNPRHLVPATEQALEAIALKAMAKQKSERYVSVKQLTSDVQQWLADEPVGAYREPWTVRARRWGRRHRLLVTGVVALLAAALPLLLLVVLVADRARQQAEADREAIRAQKEISERNEADAIQAREETAHALARTTAVKNFLQDEVFAVVRPQGYGLGRDVTMRQVLDAAVPKIKPAFAGFPEDEAALCTTLAMSYYRLGLYPQSESLNRRGLELRRQELGEDHRDTLTSLHNLADTLRAQNKLAEAEPLFRQALAGKVRVLGAENEDTLNSRENLAILLAQQRKFGEAESSLREILAARSRGRAEDNLPMSTSLINLSSVLAMQGKFADAEASLRQGLDGYRRKHGEEHPETLTAMHNLGAILLEQKKFSEAEPVIRRATESRSRVLGPDHPNTLKSQHNLADLYRGKGKLAEAEAQLREVVERRRRVHGEGHPTTMNSVAALAGIFQEQRRFAEAEALLLAGYKALSSASNVPPAEVNKTRERLAKLYDAWGKKEEAGRWRLPVK
jgi:eukaryotic-like serine/threonine-protein kinase